MKSEFKKKLLRIVLILVNGTAILLFFSFSGMLFPREEPLLEPPLNDTLQIQYETHQVQRGEISDKVTVHAYLSADRSVEVLFQSEPGYLKDLSVNVGDQVIQGQILAHLDSEQIRNEISRQDLLLQNSKDQYEQYEALSAIDMELAEIDLQELEKELETSRKLSTSISGQELNRMENQVNTARLNLEKQKLKRQYDLIELERQISLDSLELQRLRSHLEKTLLRAPITGEVEYVTSRKPGEWIESYRRMFSIADLSHLVLRYNGSKSDSFIKGKEILILYNDKEYTGRVLQTPSEVPDEDLARLGETVLFQFDNPPADMELGDSADIELVRQHRENVLILPKRYLNNYVGRKYVKILEDGLIREVDVEIGMESATEVEIRSGLKEGDQVVE